MQLDISEDLDNRGFTVLGYGVSKIRARKKDEKFDCSLL